MAVALGVVEEIAPERRIDSYRVYKLYHWYECESFAARLQHVADMTLYSAPRSAEYRTLGAREYFSLRVLYFKRQKFVTFAIILALALAFSHSPLLQPSPACVITLKSSGHSCSSLRLIEYQLFTAPSLSISSSSWFQGPF